VNEVGDAKDPQTHQHSQDKTSPQAWLVAVVLAATVLVLAAAAFLAWRTTQIPFPGLFTEPTLVVNGMGDLTWAGYAAGLEYGDHLIAFDGRLLDTTTALMRELSLRGHGDVVALAARDMAGALREVSVRLGPIPTEALTGFFILPYVLGLIYLGIGIWVFLARRHETAGQVFGLLCALIALSLGLMFDLYTTHRLPRLWIVAFSLLGSVVIHLALVFPQQARFLHRTPELRYLAYVPGVIIAIINQFTLADLRAPWAYYATWRPAFIFAGISVVLLVMMLYRGRHSQSPIVQAQARAILLGSLVSFSPIAIWFIVSRFVDWILSPALILPWLVLFPLSIAYAILRYRLLNINLMVSQSIVYATLSVAIVGAYFLILYLIGLVLGVAPQANNPVILGVFVLLLTLVTNPVRVRLQRAVDALFLRQAIDHRQVMQRFVDRLAETTGLPSVLQALDDMLEEGWDLQFAALFLYDPQRAQYVPHAIGSGSFPSTTFAWDGPLANQMFDRGESVYLYPDRPLPPELRAEGESLEPLRSALLIPVTNHGWLALGSKRDGKPFSSDDLAILQALGSQVTVALEKARLFSNLERRMTEVDVLRWVGQAVNFAMDVDDLIELIYAQTSRVLDTGNFYIALYNPEKEMLSFAFYVEEGERIYQDDEWSIDIGLGGEIIRTGRPIVTDDYIQECKRRGITPGGRPGRAWMGMPLSAGDRVIGVMNISSFDSGVTYSEDQQQFFSAIADQAAAILDKAHLYQEMEERARQLSALNEVGSVITSTLDLSAVLNLIMDKAVELIQAEAGSLVLMDQDTSELVFRVTAGPGSADLVGKRLPAGTGIMGTVVQEHEPVIIRDAQSDERWAGEQDEEFVTRSIIAVPMVSRGRAIGVIELLNRRDGIPFDEDDARLLTAFAANAAVSIENARLFTQTDQALAARVEELSMMQQIDRELNATLDYNQVMDLTLDWAVRTTGADAGLVAVMAEEDGATGLRFLANQGYPDELIAAYEDILWPLDQGTIGRVVRTGEPEFIEDVRGDPDYTETVPGMVAQLAVPIRREEQIVGVITLESSQQALLDEEALEFVIRLADHAAISIENAWLFGEVQRANDAKTEFVSFVSHELKQPMTSMRGYTDLLAKGAAGGLNDMQQSFLETIRSNVNRMDSLVSSLLDISRIESGRIRINLEDVSVEQVVEEALRTIRGQIEAKQQPLVVEVTPNLPLVRGDRERLVQVLTNLVSNAYKYTPKGGQITVRAQTWSDGEGATGQDGFVMCSVTDTGIGMSQEDQERLFTKYFRSEDPSVRSEAGTGLGLVITKSLVELQGGEIWVESELGRGSTFAFTVPTVQQK
jgi:signal transduction histidine kinase